MVVSQEILARRTLHDTRQGVRHIILIQDSRLAVVPSGGETPTMGEAEHQPHEDRAAEDWAEVKDKLEHLER